MGRLDYVDYLFINEVEGRYILDLPQDSPILPQDMLNKVQENTAPKHHHDHGRRRKRGSVRRRILDRGIGEGRERGQHRRRGRRLHGTTVAQLILGQGFKRGHPLGPATYAALSVTIDGTIPAYRPMDEVEEFIKSLG